MWVRHVSTREKLETNSKQKSEKIVMRLVPVKGKLFAKFLLSLA